MLWKVVLGLYFSMFIRLLCFCCEEVVLSLKFCRVMVFSGVFGSGEF